MLVQPHLVHPAVVIHAVLSLEGGQLILQNIEVGKIAVEGKVPVRVELSQLVQVLGIVQLLLRVDRVQVLQAHVVLVQVAVVCLLVQRGDDVVQLGGIVVPGLGGRRDGRRGGAPAAGGCRLAQCVRRGPVALPQVALAVAVPLGIVLLGPGKIRPVDDGVQQRLLLFRILVLIAGALLVEVEAPEAVDLVQHAVDLVRNLPVRDVVRSVFSAGIPAVVGAQLVCHLVCQQFCLRCGGLVDVLFQSQNAHAELRVSLRGLQVRLGKFLKQPFLVGRLYKVVIGIGRHGSYLLSFSDHFRRGVYVAKIH